MIHKVKATREGLIGHITASGYVIEDQIPFVALPSRRALHHTLDITNPLNGRQVRAIVLEVGPFNVRDDGYVFGGDRPMAERGLSVSGHGTNGAGIDLGEAVWKALGMT